MDNNEISPLDVIEWEALRSPVNIKIINNTKIVPGLNEISIARSDSYGISSFVKGYVDKQKVNTWLNRQESSTPGQPPETFDIIGCNEINKVTLRDVVLTGQNTLRGDGLFSANLYTPQIEIEILSTDKQNVAWISDWYLNGPEHQLLFYRPTKREASDYHLRERNLPDNMEYINWSLNSLKSASSGRDYFLVTPTSGPKFIVTKVPQHLGPKWSHNVGIEYQNIWGGIPSDDDRKAIGDIVGFILGRHLLQIGTSQFNEHGIPLLEKINPAWGSDVQATCENLDYSPINMDRKSQVMNKFEQILSDLVPKYLNVRRQFDIESALWAYWVARRMPLGTSLPLVATAVEILKNGWYKSSKTKCKGVYMNQKDFQALLKDELPKIQDKLSGVPYGTSMINKLIGIFRMSISEQNENFFSEIGLPIDDGERYVMKERNKMVHSSNSAQTDWVKINAITHGYFTLFHRVFLKLLGYDGTYVDRSVPGWPQKPMDEPISIRE